MKPHYRIAWILAQHILRFLVGFTVKGRENIPSQGGLLIASNHISGLDPPLLGFAATRELHFLAKKELFENPFLGWLITTYNAIPIKRGATDLAALRKAIELMRQGQALLVFPEGTRSRNGTLGQAKHGVGMIALSTKTTIVPAIISGTNQPLKWLIRKKARVIINFGEPIRPEQYQGLEANRESYRLITQEVMQRIRGLKESLGRADNT